MRTVRGLATALATIGVLAGLMTGSAGAASGTGIDVGATREGRADIAATVASFRANGTIVSAADLSARRQADGSVLVLVRGYTARRTADGYRVAAPSLRGGKSARTATTSTQAVVAASWSLTGSGCFAALFRGAAHMDTCYKSYKMASDGSNVKDYYRLDFYATMFAEGRTLDWGWISADQDAGAAMQFVDWSPDADIRQNCASFGLSVSVAGVGGGYTRTFCELNDISKSAGPAFGWFKDRWSWDEWMAVRDRDRAVAMIVGTSMAQGGAAPRWGLSWDFAAH